MKVKGFCTYLYCAMMDLLLLAVCHYSLPGLTIEGLGEKAKDSLTYLFRYYYTWNTNLGVLDNSIQLEYPPAEDAYVSLNKDDRVVVTGFSIHPQDNVNSIWVKLTYPQDIQGWVRNRDLVHSFAPIGSISQFIHLFSNTHVSYPAIILALSAGAYLLRALMKKQLQMVYFNDIDSVYPLFLCLLTAFSAAVYEMMQMFVPDTWEYFYLSPTFSPFKVPFILSVFLLSIWLFIVVALAVFGDLFRQLALAAAIFHLLGLMSCCILYYFFFILTAHAYIGYLFSTCFIWLLVKKMRRNSDYKYHCGSYGQKLREKGVCPHCGAINE